MTDLPEDISKLLGELPTEDVAPIGQPCSKPDNVAALRAVPPPTSIDPWRNSVEALRGIADREESGEEAPIKRAVIVCQREDGTLAIHGIGPAADDFALIVLLQLGLHQISREMLFE